MRDKHDKRVKRMQAPLGRLWGLPLIPGLNMAVSPLKGFV